MGWATRRDAAESNFGHNRILLLCFPRAPDPPPCRRWSMAPRSARGCPSTTGTWGGPRAATRRRATSDTIEFFFFASHVPLTRLLAAGGRWRPGRPVGVLRRRAHGVGHAPRRGGEQLRTQSNSSSLLPTCP